MANQNRANPIVSQNWLKRMMRMSTPKAPRQQGMSDPSQSAMGMFQQGARVGADGTIQPTQDFGGMMGKASQGINSLSRGVRGGQFSSLGQPPNSMHEQNPGYFNRGGSQGFGEMLGQTREQRVAQSQQEGTFGTIRDKFNLDNAAKGSSMNEFGNIISKLNNQPAPSAGQGGGQVATAEKPQYTPSEVLSTSKGFDSSLIEPKGFGAASDAAQRNRDALQTMGRRIGSQVGPPEAGKVSMVSPTQGVPTGASTLPTPSTPSQMDMNRQALEQGAAGIKLRREASGELPTITNSDGIKRIEGKYGSGASTRVPSAGGEGMIGKQKFSEVMQGLANKPGVASPGDRFQPQQWTNLKRTKK